MTTVEASSHCNIAPLVGPQRDGARRRWIVTHIQEVESQKLMEFKADTRLRGGLKTRAQFY